MGEQITLRPSDIVVALQLAITPSAHFKGVSVSTSMSVGECHNAVRRLRVASLILADERRPSADALVEFLVHGAPYAFPPVVGATVPGVPTAYASPAFAGIVESPDIHVWPHADGTARGASLVPLYPAAPLLPDLNPNLYDLLSIVDALRVGTTRVRKLSGALLRARLAEARE